MFQTPIAGFGFLAVGIGIKRASSPLALSNFSLRKVAHRVTEFDSASY